jgi:hypothetical protein
MCAASIHRFDFSVCESFSEYFTKIDHSGYAGPALRQNRTGIARLRGAVTEPDFLS